MNWVHVADVLRLGCKNMPQEMRVCEPMESKRGEVTGLAQASAEGSRAPANRFADMFG